MCGTSPTCILTCGAKVSLRIMQFETFVNSKVYFFSSRSKFIPGRKVSEADTPVMVHMSAPPALRSTEPSALLSPPQSPSARTVCLLPQIITQTSTSACFVSGTATQTANWTRAISSPRETSKRCVYGATGYHGQSPCACKVGPGRRDALYRVPRTNPRVYTFSLASFDIFLAALTAI